MSDSSPTMQDAELILRLYDLRREEVLRANREKLNFEFWPTSLEDIQAVMDMQHPLNTAWRQVASYWEMVYGIGARGITHPEYLVENNGEGMLTFLKVQPHLPQLRETNTRAFQNHEWAATQTDAGAEILERLGGFFAEKLGR